MTTFIEWTDAEEALYRDLFARKAFTSYDQADRYLVACWHSHCRGPRSAYRAGPALSPLARLGQKVENNLRWYAANWEAGACYVAEHRAGA